MKRKEMLERISAKTNLPKSIINDTLNALGEVISEGLKEGKIMKPHKMVIYHSKFVKAHTGKVCGLEYSIPDHLSPRVKVTKVLKDKLKEVPVKENEIKKRNK